MIAPTPHVRVLLATYNGQPWLNEQIDSLFAQRGVSVSVVASDDCSTDETLIDLVKWSMRAPLIVMPTSTRRFGSAHRNFMRLIRDAPLADADYVALCDQDDVWLPSKLERAVDQLINRPGQAYSSNVIAFWPDGRQRLVRKSQPQRRVDHLFGSPGPGCTFVITREVFNQMRGWVDAGFEQMQHIWVHDWLIYAYVRQRGMRWIIDEQPGLLYRQHGRNEIGVNAGWRAALSRWRHVRTGAYRRDILGIADAVGNASAEIGAVRRLCLLDRLWLIARVRDFRRAGSESLLLGVLLLFMPKSRS